VTFLELNSTCCIVSLSFFLFFIFNGDKLSGKEEDVGSLDQSVDLLQVAR
jgi:hypothetical protein